MNPMHTLTSEPRHGKTFAKANGLTTYFSKTPCIRGHLSERETKTGVCLACQAIIAEQGFSSQATYPSPVACERNPEHGSERYTRNDCCVKCSRATVNQANKRIVLRLTVAEKARRMKLIAKSMGIDGDFKEGVNMREVANLYDDIVRTVSDGEVTHKFYPRDFRAEKKEALK